MNMSRPFAVALLVLATLGGATAAVLTRTVTAGAMVLEVPRGWKELPPADLDPSVLAVYANATVAAACALCHYQAQVSASVLPAGTGPGFNGITSWIKAIFPTLGFPPGTDPSVAANPAYFYSALLGPPSATAVEVDQNASHVTSSLVVDSPRSHMSRGVEYYVGYVGLNSAASNVSEVVAFKNAVVNGTIYTMSIQFGSATYAQNKALVKKFLDGSFVSTKP